ncbi:LysE family translocator [Spirosoma spitsbergense]|uniref:LysE family translocator n=1 Tax=Spirosoma spitsbergense TaxID=431554 RepID=UPI0003605857|nr:LysE family transporter [Spirosoma spitsbergense]
MSYIISTFLAGLLVSFLGTLPPGVLNVTVTRITLQQGRKAAFWFVLACGLVEWGYSYLAVRLTQLVVENGVIRYLTDGLTAVVLLIMGIYYLRKPAAQPVASQSDATPFRLGVGLSLLNLAAFPFWTIYTTLLIQKGWVSLMHTPDLFIYVTGIALGTLAGLWVFVWLSGRIRLLLTSYTHRIDQLTGLLLVGLSVVQSVIWLAYPL